MSTPMEREYEWQDRAVCRDKPAEWWFPRRGEAPRDDVRALCRSCPVRAECLTWALSHMERYGVWGGYTFTELRRFRLKGYCHQCRAWIPRAEVIDQALADIPPRQWYCTWCREHLARVAS